VGKTTAANLEERFDAGEDVSDYFTFTKGRKPDWPTLVVTNADLLKKAMAEVGKRVAADMEKALSGLRLPVSACRFELLQAAERADWGQVVANGGPPCFHLEGDGTFCLRAERWQGHTQRDRWPEHRFVSLRALLELWPLGKLPPSPRRSKKRS
jgi:hypothetical protein